MKRSKQVQLVISGAIAVGVLSTTGCEDTSKPAADLSMVSSDRNQTNNQYVPGVGYYHAPYGAWYPFPYNSFRPGQGYFHGGQWSQNKHESAVTASKPNPANSLAAQNALRQSAAAKQGVKRSGFGSVRMFGRS